MDIHEVNKVLREKAVAAGLCDDWQERVWNRDLTMTELLTIYKRGIDFSLKQEWFDYDFFKREFPIEELHEANIYIDEDVDIMDADSGTYVFLGHCRGTVRFRNFSVGNLYIRHTSDMRITAEDMAKVFVSVHDGSEVTADQMDCSTIRLYDRRG